MSRLTFTPMSPRHVLWADRNALTVDPAKTGKNNGIVLEQDSERCSRTSVSPDGPVMWICRYEIDWPSQKRSHFAGCADSFQALILALQMIGAEIYASAYHKAGSLKWFERYRGYGFPVGGNLRDLLIGDETRL